MQNSMVVGMNSILNEKTTVPLYMVGIVFMFLLGVASSVVSYAFKSEQLAKEVIEIKEDRRISKEKNDNRENAALERERLLISAIGEINGRLIRIETKLDTKR